MLREVARYDVDAFERLGNWMLRDVLVAYEAILRDRALTVYRHEQLIFVLGGTKDKKPPAIPPILVVPLDD